MNGLSVNKERLTTGAALVALVLVIGLIDNFFVMWLSLGVVYILAFREAVKLFDVERDNLLPFAAALWIIAAFYPYGDDLFVLAGVAYASAVAFNKNIPWRDFLPFSIQQQECSSY